VTAPTDPASLTNAEKDALILAQAEMIAALTQRIAELEAKLGLPPKTPDNSSTPPSKGQKPSAAAAAKPKNAAHTGAHRPLHPSPTTKRDIFAASCQHCGADVSQNPQLACEAYDHVEIPDIAPDVTRVTLHGGTCPCCARRFKAPAPSDMPKGSPFGENLRALVIYLRFTPEDRGDAIRSGSLWDRFRASGAASVRHPRPRHQRGSTGSP
jgi:transposase